MTYERVGNEIMKVTSRARAKVKPVNGKHWNEICIERSDDRIREIIRGMDDRERMIVLDEIGNIYGARKEKAYV